MKSNELRVGNWCQSPYEEGPFKIDAEHILHIEQGMDECSIVGIPLTPEILVKAGFDNKSSTTDYIFQYGDFIIGGTQKRLFPCVWGEDGLQDYGDLIEYVHQLQNLYFALTGKELTFDL
jgi:hypothetical protein